MPKRCGGHAPMECLIEDRRFAGQDPALSQKENTMQRNRQINAEQQRLEAQKTGAEDWRLWGPYLSERAWGTVREDYSAHGEAWEHFSQDHARSRAYRWSEDG